MQRPEVIGKRWCPWLYGLAFGVALHATPLQAVEFNYGDFNANFYNTLSYGATFRTVERESVLANSVNGNDGNLNYDRGLISSTFKLNTELELNYRNFGAFVRVNGFFDTENVDGKGERTKLHRDATSLVGQDIQVLDLYVTGAFEPGGIPTELRFGRQVLNWGESTFIQNGINAFNIYDVRRLRLPGSELRDALWPVPMIWGSASPTDALTVEAFYQLDWDRTRIDPVGSYFSTTDYVGPGGRKAVLGFGSVSDLGGGFDDLVAPGITQVINADLATAGMIDCRITSPPPMLDFAGDDCQAKSDPDFLSVLRSEDRRPNDARQWGVAVRYLAEGLNDTEFGLYFVNYHSRVPVISARTGTSAGRDAAKQALLAIARGANTRGAIIKQAINANPMTLAQIRAGVRARVESMVPPGTPVAVIDAQVEQVLPEAINTQVAHFLSNPEALPKEAQDAVNQIAGTLELDRYAKTANYFIEYPEDIQLFGASFNTQFAARAGPCKVNTRIVAVCRCRLMTSSCCSPALLRSPRRLAKEI